MLRGVSRCLVPDRNAPVRGVSCSRDARPGWTVIAIQLVFSPDSARDPKVA